MAVNLSALAGAGQQFFDNNGNPLSGGKLWSYQAGTTTPQTTYTTASGNVAHTNPIVLDSAGRVATGEIWLTLGSNYKFILMTSVNVTLATWDNITGINGTGITSNASNVVYDPAGTGAVATTVQAKLRESVSAADFGLSEALPQNATANRAAIQAAIDSLPASQWFTGDFPKGGGTVYIPTGRYIIDGPIYLRNATSLVGDGRFSSVLISTTSAAAISTSLYAGETATVGISVSDLGIEAGTYGLYCLRVYKSTFNNIVVRAAEYGVFSDLCVDTSFDNVFVQGCVYGVYARGVTGSTYDSTNYFNNLYASYCTTAGIFLDGSTYGNKGFSLNNVIVEYCATGLRIKNCYETDISTLWLEGNTSQDLLLESGQNTQINNMRNGVVVNFTGGTNTTLINCAQNAVYFAPGAGTRNIIGFPPYTITDSDTTLTYYNGIASSSNANGAIDASINKQMTCTMYGEAVYSTATSLVYTWTYPAAFAAIPRVSATLSFRNTSNISIVVLSGTFTTGLVLDAIGTTTVVVRVVGTGFLAGDKIGLHLVAIGTAA